MQAPTDLRFGRYQNVHAPAPQNFYLVPVGEAAIRQNPSGGPNAFGAASTAATSSLRSLAHLLTRAASVS